MHLAEGSIGLLVGLVVVGALEVDLEETVELHYLALGNKYLVTARHRDAGGRLLEFSIGHLGGDGALPDQVIELLLLRCARDGVVADVGGTDGLVSLLSALAGGAVMAHLEVTLPDVLLDFLADGTQCQVAQVDRVGTHVGNETFFVQALSQSHRLLDREAELAGGFLLQGAGGERRRRGALERLDGHVGHLELCLLAVLQERGGGVMVGQMAVQLSRELASIGITLGEVGRDTVIGFSLEILDFLLTLGNQTHGDALYTTG